MKYDLTYLPLGSPSRAKAQLANLDLLKAVKTCRIGNIALEVLQPELRECLDQLYARKAYGVILSAYYQAGEIGPHSVDHLLRCLYENRDFPTLLKQAYRFDVYGSLKKEIDDALAWHFNGGLHDAEAWRRKFTKLREQELLCPDTPEALPVEAVIEEDLPDNSTGSPRVFELKPLVTSTVSRPCHRDEESINDPYIISQTARAKMEGASRTHQGTLHILKVYLQNRKRAVSESKLIDAFAVLQDGPAIFEIKSITESNERDQIRHALSQLYEYRFIHSMANASLWIVFSQPLSSQWYIDYLTSDRGIRTVWSSNGTLEGPSIHLLI